MAARSLAAGIAAVAVAIGIGRFVYTPILPAMMAEARLSPADAGIVASANFVGYFLGAVLGAGRWGEGHERRIALAALLANAVLLLAMGSSNGVYQFALIRFLAGLASAFTFVFATSAVMSGLAAAGRPELQILLFTGVGLGIAMSSVTTGAVYVAGADWHFGWIAAGLIAILGLLVVALFLERKPKTIDRPPSEPPLPRDRDFRAVVLAYALFGVGYVATSTFLIAISRELQRGPVFESGVWLAAGLAAAPSVWLWHRLSVRIGLRRTYAIGCVVEAVGIAAGVLVPGVAGSLIGAVLFGGTFVAITAIGIMAGRAMAPASPRRALAVMTAWFGIGQIVGPIAAGYLSDTTGSYLEASLGAATLLLLSAIMMLTTRRDDRKSPTVSATIPPEL